LTAGSVNRHGSRKGGRSIVGKRRVGCNEKRSTLYDDGRIEGRWRVDGQTRAIDNSGASQGSIDEGGTGDGQSNHVGTRKVERSNQRHCSHGRKGALNLHIE
jgi:hypothetical protein